MVGQRSNAAMRLPPICWVTDERRVSRKIKGRNKARGALVTLYERHPAGARNQRKDDQHKLSRTLVDQVGCIPFEAPSFLVFHQMPGNIQSFSCLGTKARWLKLSYWLASILFRMARYRTAAAATA